jgi:CDP-diacylglycerol--glycerol-3-phosphate 3-phosphatidyltransferase
MKDKNLPNKLTILRIILSIIILFIMLFPWSMVNVEFKRFLINGTLILDSKMLIVGVLFVIASITDFLDGYLARKYKLVSDFGKVMDAIADKILINGLLIVLATDGYIYPVVPVIIILRDTIVNTLKMIAGEKDKAVGAIKTGKFKTAFLMIGLTLKLFGNLPFGLINIAVDDFFIITATVLSVVSGVEYYNMFKKYLTKN